MTVGSASKNAGSDNEVLLFAIPPVGDWYLVTMQCGQYDQPATMNVEVAWMCRVICWHHVKSERELRAPYMKAVCESGLAIYPKEYVVEYAYVSGDDRAPNGQLWREIYARCKSWKPGQYEINDLSVFQIPRPPIDQLIDSGDEQVINPGVPLPDVEAGRNLGRTWAADEADDDDMQLLREHVQSENPDLSAYGVATALQGDCEAIWCVSAEELTDQFVIGWVAGALEVFRQV